MNQMTAIETVADPVILYVLMRTDLPDYVAGKSMAQANHAGTQFMGEVLTNSTPDLSDDLDDWLEQSDGGGFGTCIVLGCSYPQMEQRLGTARELGLVAGVVHDPTYPIRDGHKMQVLPVDTCGYVFGRKSRCSLALRELPLFGVDR